MLPNARPDAEVINDPGGAQIHKNFRSNYSNTLLRLCTPMIQELWPMNQELMLMRKAETIC